MTRWGGLDVVRFAREAGFPGGTADMAARVAFAASGWQDSHYVASPRDARSDEVGLWALTSDLTGVMTPRYLLDPGVAATAAYHVWEGASRNWQVFPVVTHQRGRTFVVASRQIDAGQLLSRSADDMPHLMEPRGSRYRGRDADQIMFDATPFT